MNTNRHPGRIFTTICLLAAVTAVFAQEWNPVAIARKNCAAYSKLINYSSDQVNQLCDQMDNNRDGSALANNGDITHEQAVAILQQSLAARWNSQKNIDILLDLSRQYRDMMVQQAVANRNDPNIQQAMRNATNGYKDILTWSNNNADAIWDATNKLRAEDPTGKYDDAPLRNDAAPLPDLGNIARNAAVDASRDAAQRTAESAAQNASHSAAQSAAQSATDNCPTPMH